MSALDDGRQMLSDVQSLLDAIEAVQLAKTPEEEAAAKLHLEVECALGHAASMERARKRAFEMIRRPCVFGVDEAIEALNPKPTEEA